MDFCMVKAASFAITLSPSGKLPSVSIDFKSELVGGGGGNVYRLNGHFWRMSSFFGAIHRVNPPRNVDNGLSLFVFWSFYYYMLFVWLRNLSCLFTFLHFLFAASCLLTSVVSPRYPLNVPQRNWSDFSTNFLPDLIGWLLNIFAWE